MDNDAFHSSAAPQKQEPGPFLARIVSHLDTSYMGDLEVEILRPVGNNSGSSGSEVRTVHYMSPFYGVTSAQFINQDPNNYDNTQKSYGMWMIPPDVGTTVVVFFIQGDPKRGYWIGCIQDENANFMVPGLASSSYVSDGGEFTDAAGRSGRVPVAEYNKKINNTNADPTSFTKPMHPLASALAVQGLLKDDIRGITTSSARREVPSMVFGISTPGPVDKRTNAPRGPIGKKESQIPNAFISRLGGATFVMDDGDPAYIRKAAANVSPPEYVSVEQGETGGDVTIPHNELVRIRTRTGHQILLHNSEDLIYIGNAKGTTWIELTSNGKIDIYAKDSISVHSDYDINFDAGRDINLTAKNNINLNATKSIYAYGGDNFEIKAGKDGKLTAVTSMNMGATGGKVNLTSSGDTNIKAGTKLTQNAAGYYSLPGGGGTAAVSATAAAAATAPKVVRVPSHEPWPQHENLDPANFTPDKIKVPAPGAAVPKTTTPSAFEKYTTSMDTFKRNPPPSGK
jgi:uncharacterized protein (DUF2345 family)